MASHLARDSQNSAAQAIDIAVAYVQREELRLRSMIESELSSNEQRFQALKDLAYLSGIVVRELADMRMHTELTGSLAGIDEVAGPGEASKRTCIEEQMAEGGSENHPAEVRLDSLHEDICNSLSEGVYFVDKERKLTYWNRGATEISGFSREEAIGRYCFDNFLRHVDEHGRSLCLSACPLAATLKDGKAREHDLFLHHKSGYQVPVSVRVSPVVDKAGKLVGAVEVFSHSNSKQALERRAKELEKLAYVDSLTGLSNRRHIELKLRQALEEVEQFGRRAGVLLLDIDHFKKVNDFYGHAIGDLVLKTVAERLNDTLRPVDSVGRWGGEEFLFVAMDVGLGELETIARRCCELIESCTVTVENKQLQVTVSVGAALLNKNESTERAVKNADLRLYEAKARGGNSIQVT